MSVAIRLPRPSAVPARSVERPSVRGERMPLGRRGHLWVHASVSLREGRTLAPLTLGGVIDISNVTGLGARLYEMFEHGVDVVVVDCAGLRAIAACGVEVLSAVADLLRARGGRLSLVNVPPSVLRALAHLEPEALGRMEVACLARAA